jgi:hypothetical protein
MRYLWGGSVISRFLFLVQILFAPDGGGNAISRFLFLVQILIAPDGGGSAYQPKCLQQTFALHVHFASANKKFLNNTNEAGFEAYIL